MWLLFASLTALFEASKDATGKQSLKTLDEYAVLFSFSAIGVICMVPLLLWSGIPEIQPDFWRALLIGGSLNILAFTLYVRALKIADLSLTVPLVTLTPLFLLLTSPLIVQEWPTWADAVGVVLLVIGAYVLNLDLAAEKSVQAAGAKPQNRFWAPLRAMVANRGSRLMLLVAFLWSITSNFDKVGVVNASPLMWAIALFSVIAAGMVPFVFFRPGRTGLAPLFEQWRLLGLTGAFNAVAISFQMMALPLAPVAQVIAVKRTSALISVLFGHLFFGERGVRSRLVGAGIMVSGVVIMALY